MNPLTVTTGGLSLLSVCIKVSIRLLKLRNGAGDAKVRIGGLLSDVEDMGNVVQSMEATLNHLQMRETFETTGHIGAHRRSLN